MKNVNEEENEVRNSEIYLTPTVPLTAPGECWTQTN